MYYRFVNRDNEYFDMPFESDIKAKEFSEKYDYTFMGKTADFHTGYFDKLSKANIQNMINWSHVDSRTGGDYIEQI